jgi:Tfp pilus assembly protein PilF
MIVKDEEEVLMQCLASVRGLVNEIIVVDTGSADRSIEIAESFGAKVFKAAWEDDFSKVRNLSLSHASCEWILVLDADEVIDTSDHARIRGLVDRDNTAYKLTQRHYTNDLRQNNAIACSGKHPEWEREYQGYFESSLIRLFPAHKGIEYRGVVHELVESTAENRAELTVEDSGVLIHHFGFTPEALARRDKSTLYSNLAAKKISEEPSNWQAFYELGIQHNLAGRREEAAVAFIESLKLDPNQLWVWSNLAQTLTALNKADQANEAFQRALALDPFCKEVLSNYGVFLFRCDRLNDAEAALRRALEVEQGFITGWCNLGMVLARAGKASAAALAYHRAIMINPLCVTARASLASLHIDAGQYRIALEIVEPVLDVEDPHHQLALLYTALALRGLNKLKDASDILGQLLEEPNLQSDVRSVANDTLKQMAN